MRKLLTPAFHAEILKPYTKLFQESTRTLLVGHYRRRGTNWGLNIFYTHSYTYNHTMKTVEWAWIFVQGPLNPAFFCWPCHIPKCDVVSWLQVNCSDGYKIRIQIKDGNRLIGKAVDKFVKMFLIILSASFGFSMEINKDQSINQSVRPGYESVISRSCVTAIQGIICKAWPYLFLLAGQVVSTSRWHGVLSWHWFNGTWLHTEVCL